jgi:excisionase family DNA binding protein
MNLLSVPHEVSMIPASPISVSLKEGAAMLGVSASTVRRFARDGRLRTVQLGRRRVVPVQALEELIRKRAEGQS